MVTIKDIDASSSSVLPDLTSQRFTLSEIKSATNNFDETLVIGRGGFGNVYRCSTKIVSVSEVVVKRLHSMSNQGAHEFEAEIEVLSKLRHGNLVALIGYCNEENEMALVYEFMSNGTLEDNLHKPDSSLPWLQLLKVCIGAARGLDYLHTGTSTQHGIIHRDVKSSNILLDANFDAKISDFGLARIGLIDRTHVSTAVKGTFGYMDPSYFYTGKLTSTSDVYAFGVVLFEVLTGKKAVDSTLDEEQWSLAAWAQHQIKQGKVNQIVDPRLMGKISKRCLKEFARIAGHCLHTQPKKRPTMAEVVYKLESILSQEREIANSVVDEEGFIYKLRSFFTGKVDVAIENRSDFNLHPEQQTKIAVDSKPLPRIEELQIFGESYPGHEIQACGYSRNGTTGCSFEWLRHKQDGSFEYIVGAKQPTYTVTADDVDTYLAVEVQPHDVRKRNGKLVKCFANNNKNITCHPDMLRELEKILSRGHASFKLLIRKGDIDTWEPGVLEIKKSGYVININGVNGSVVVVNENYTATTIVSLRAEISLEFSIVGPGGVEQYLRADDSLNDVSCSRDMIVLTMRLFIKRAMDGKLGKKKKEGFVL